jgi:hypothetical protein
MKDVAVVGLVGTTFGFFLARIGFSSWDQVHAMFTFSDLRLFLTFCTAVAVLVVTWRVIGRFATIGARRDIHPGILPGGVLFGMGWAICGACPSIALVQIGEGQLGGLLTLTGIFAGNWLYSIVHERKLRWSTGSCLDD